MARGLVAVPKLYGLRAARLAKAWTQQELADAAGVHVVTVSALENGAEAGVRSLKKLSQALGVEPVVLMRRPKEQ
jgi:transcriptional regulator with XRE-family HTH domain